MTANKERQREFDTARCTRQHWLHKMIIPPFKRKVDGIERTTNADALVPFMVSVEFVTYGDKERAATLAEIGQQMVFHMRRKKPPSPTTVRRAMHDCIELGLLTVKPATGRGNFFEINFFRVKEILMEHPDTASVVMVPNSHAGTPSNSVGTPSNSVGERKVCTSKLESQTFQDGRGTRSNSVGQTFQVGRGTAERTSSSRAHLNQNQNQSETNLNESTDGSEEEKDPYECEEPGAANKVTWLYPITSARLSISTSVDEMFEHACSEGYVHTSDRVNFFKTARWMVRREQAGKHGTAKPVKCLHAYFTNLVKHRTWRGGDTDRKWAIENITAASRFKSKMKSFSRGPDAPKPEAKSDPAPEETKATITTAAASYVPKHVGESFLVDFYGSGELIRLDVVRDFESEGKLFFIFEHACHKKAFEELQIIAYAE